MAIVTAYMLVGSDPGGSDLSMVPDVKDLYINHLMPPANVVEATSSLYIIEAPINSLDASINAFSGADFTYDAAHKLTGGVVTGWELRIDGEGSGESKLLSILGLSVPATSFAAWIDSGEIPTAPVLLAGDDSITGTPTNETLWGYAGNDTIDGNGSGYGPRDGNVLQGGDGNDVIHGGGGVDHINGNQGSDTAYGGLGDDWVVGGKDNDLLSGDAGSDMVLGNLGNDTLDGGDGADVVRGGQGDDVVAGGAGDDYVSGDRGDDTVSGGAGADRFHAFGEAGVDRVTDFHSGEGDRVMLDPGSVYSVAQVDADTVISLSGGARMILVGVQLSTLSGAWIFEG